MKPEYDAYNDFDEYVVLDADGDAVTHPTLARALEDAKSGFDMDPEEKVKIYGLIATLAPPARVIPDIRWAVTSPDDDEPEKKEPPANPVPQNRHAQPWTQDELHILFTQRDDGRVWDEIASVLGRTASACRNAYYSYYRDGRGKFERWQGYGGRFYI